MSLIEDIGFNKSEIKSQVEQICIEKNIDLIVPLAKKGNILFKDIFGENDLIVDEKEIKVLNDRIINKFDSFSFLNDKNVLIFDDSFRTGSRIYKTISFFNDKTMSSLIREQKEILFNEFGGITNYIFYTVVQCKKEDVPNRKNFIVESYKEYGLEDYYEFCIKEAVIFQKSLCCNSIDLPIFKTTINDIEMLDDIFKNEPEIDFERTHTYIGNEKINLGVLYFNIPELEVLSDELIIAATCKLRYEINNEGQYDCIFTPMIVTKSMSYSDLENLFNTIFDLKRKKTSLKVNMRLSFVKFYRYINYVLSFAVGNLIKSCLSEYYIDLKYSKEFESQFIETIDGKENQLLINKLIEYENFNNVLDDLSNFSCENDDHQSQKYEASILSFDEIKETIYDSITEEREIDGNLEYNFTPIEDFSSIYNNSDNLKNFIKALYQCIESYSITNELDFINSRSFLERGFVNGECSSIALPYRDKLVYFGIRAFYEKINRNYELYKNNYDLFIEKYYIFLKNEGFLKNQIMTMENFSYYINYYKNVTKDSIRKKIESKTYLLDQEDMIDIYKYLKPRLEYLLTTDDFKL